MDEWFVGTIAALVLVVAAAFGGIFAESTISTACKNIGAFQVKDTVYECKLKEKT